MVVNNVLVSRSREAQEPCDVLTGVGTTYTHSKAELPLGNAQAVGFDESGGEPSKMAVQ